MPSGSTARSNRARKALVAAVVVVPPWAWSACAAARARRVRCAGDNKRHLVPNRDAALRGRCRGADQVERNYWAGASAVGGLTIPCGVLRQTTILQRCVRVAAKATFTAAEHRMNISVDANAPGRTVLVQVGVHAKRGGLQALGRPACRADNDDRQIEGQVSLGSLDSADHVVLSPIPSPSVPPLSCHEGHVGPRPFGQGPYLRVVPLPACADEEPRTPFERLGGHSPDARER